MLRIIPIIFGAVLITFNSFGKANNVYHEFSMNTVATGCGTYASTMYPTNSDAITIQFAIDFQGNTNEARVYYTTDGSTPNAAYGVPFGTTQAITASYVSTYNNGSGIVDVVSATIPSLPSGTVINYIVSAWHTSGGDEIFANGGTNTSSATATGFSYTVVSTLPIRMISFTGKKEKEGIVLSWATAQETNADRYETYSSANGIDFKYLGTKKAAGTTIITTQYSFTDKKPNTGNNFYKIKSVDKDGRFAYSKVLNISFAEKKSPTVTASGKTLHINLNASEKQNYSVIMVNNSGQAVKIWTIADNGTSAEHILELPPNVKQSIYRIGIKGNGPSFTHSVFIQ